MRCGGYRDGPPVRLILSIVEREEGTSALFRRAGIPFDLGKFFAG